MNYCIDYKSNFKYLKEIDELNIFFRKQDTSLPEFINRYKDKRINISINDDIDNEGIKMLDAVVEQYSDVEIVLAINNYRNKNLIEAIRDSGVEHRLFFKQFVDNWDILNGLAELNPTDMYIVNDLCFNIKDVGNYLHKKGIKVRTFPNVAQSKWGGNKNTLRTFFIRPEDVILYEKYVDTFEFFGKPNSIETYYKIYNIDKQWFGKLNEIILGLDSDIDSRYLLPSFAFYRLNCGKRCGKGYHCDMCDSFKLVADTLEKAHISSKDVIDSLVNEED